MNRLVFLLLAAGGCASAATTAIDSARGEALFRTLACVDCHSVNGNGGRIAPDLGRVVDRNFTPATLAGTMWNHAPAMWASMRAQNVVAGPLDPQAAGDLFAYFYSVRFFEKPGDAARGKRLFDVRGCAKCHGLTDSPLSAAPPVKQWRALTDPISLAEAMWNHAPRMLSEAAAKRVSWPTLSGQDLADLLVYLRNLPAMRERSSRFEISASGNGEPLFQAKGCAGCHQSADYLSRRISARTLTDIAAAMWDHAPRMRAAMKSAVPRFDTGEMRDLLSYLWARRFLEDAGNASRGKRAFANKRCNSCHGQASSGAPDLTAASNSYTGATMVSALWRHGPGMLAQMKAREIPWPRFNGHEMSDVIAYLNSHEKEKSHD
jgi:mono/diheme cytochrome c family protein